MKYWYVIILHIVLSVLASNICFANTLGFSEQVLNQAYFILTALSWVLIPLWLILNRYRNSIVLIWFFFTINNFIDSILLNADCYIISEYFLAIFVLIIIIKRNVSRRSNKGS